VFAVVMQLVQSALHRVYGILKIIFSQESFSKNGMTLRNPKKNLRKESWQRFKWYNRMVQMEQVEQVEQVEAGLQNYVEQMEQDQGGLQIPWNKWNEDKGSVQLNLST